MSEIHSLRRQHTLFCNPFKKVGYGVNNIKHNLGASLNVCTLSPIFLFSRLKREDAVR